MRVAIAGRAHGGGLLFHQQRALGGFHDIVAEALRGGVEREAFPCRGNTAENFLVGVDEGDEAGGAVREFGDVVARGGVGNRRVVGGARVRGGGDGVDLAFHRGNFHLIRVFLRVR